MKKRFVLRSLPIWPVAKVSFLILLVVGIIVGIFYAIFLSGWSYLMDSFMGSDFRHEMAFMRGFGFVMIPFFAIFYAISGTIMSIICALIYNLIASAAGGIEMELDEKTPVFQRNDERLEPPEHGGHSSHVPEGPINGF